VNHIHGGSIRIGASTTVAQTILPKLLALFKKNYPNLSFTFVQGNTDFITKHILDETVDIAIVEGAAHDPQISYTPFTKDELVLVTRSRSMYAKWEEITLKQLSSIPLVLREAGSGTLDVLRKAISKAGLAFNDLTIEIELESSIAIKQYLLHSETAAFLSVQSVVNELKYNELTIIDVKGLEIYRDFQFIHLHGKTTSLSELFMRFCKSHYNI
jgi:DNA-binding transcriptional LysR family regulator